MSCSDRLREALHAGRRPTLREVGGIEAVFAELDELVRSEHAAELVELVIDDAPQQAGQVVAASVATNDNPLILARIFDGLIAAEHLADEITSELADPVRTRIADRSDRRSAHRAAVVLDGAVRLALMTRLSRHVVLAELTAVRVDEADLFSVTAARAAGRCHDHWPDPELRAALERLLNSVPDGEAAFELGISELALAFGADDEPAVLAAMDRARALFATAMDAEEDRLDASAFASVIDALMAFASQGSPQLVAEAADAVTAAVDAHELWLDGMHVPWPAPRALALAEWSHLAGLLRRAARELEADSWLRPVEVLPDILRVYRATRSLPLARHGLDATGVESVLMPRIEARFIESSGLRAHVADWLDELSEDHELGDAARELLAAAQVDDEQGKARQSRFRPGSPGC